MKAKTQLSYVFTFLIILAVILHSLNLIFYFCLPSNSGYFCFTSCDYSECPVNHTCKLMSLQVCDKYNCNAVNEAKCIKNQCLLPRDRGVGYSSLTRFYYDYTQNKCQKFQYKGYVGNLNNFQTQSSCENTCDPLKVSKITSYYQPAESEIVGLIRTCANQTSMGIHVTFDDGPFLQTVQLLDTLKKYNVKATFFVVGKQVLKFPNIIKRILSDGHDVGLHTYSHINIVNLEKSGNYSFIEQDIIESERVLQQVTGVKPWVFRPPFGGITPKVTKFLNDRGYLVIKWNAGCVDWKLKLINKSIENLEKNFRHHGGIAVFHDYVYETAFNFSNLIEAFSNKSKYFRPFISLEECLKY